MPSGTPRPPSGGSVKNTTVNGRALQSGDGVILTAVSREAKNDLVGDALSVSDGVTTTWPAPPKDIPYPVLGIPGRNLPPNDDDDYTGDTGALTTSPEDSHFGEDPFEVYNETFISGDYQLYVPRSAVPDRFCYINVDFSDVPDAIHNDEEVASPTSGDTTQRLWWDGTVAYILIEVLSYQEGWVAPGKFLESDLPDTLYYPGDSYWGGPGPIIPDGGLSTYTIQAGNSIYGTNMFIPVSWQEVREEDWGDPIPPTTGDHPETADGWSIVVSMWQYLPPGIDYHPPTFWLPPERPCPDRPSWPYQQAFLAGDAGPQNAVRIG